MAENKGNANSETAEEKQGRVIVPKKAFTYSLIIAVVFFGIGFLVKPASFTGQVTFQETTQDQLIFISPPGCTNCDQFEPMTKAVADKLGVTFSKTGFGQQMQNPGFVLIYNNVLTVSGITSEASFKQQVCTLTENEDICKEANKLQPETPPQPPAPEVPKSDRPKAHAFVMSYCPYGLQFMKAYVQVIELLGDKADLEVNFVPYAMHGKKEIDENTRMYCIQKGQKEKFTKYLRCFIENDDYEKCITEAGVDKAELESCIASTDKEFKITELYNDQSTWSGGRFPLYNVDKELADKYDVRGSPTFVVNDKSISVTRSAEAVKQAICSAFNSPPEECNQQLSATAEQPGIGKIGADGGSGTPQTQCG